jgi:hypothetical protein
MTGKFDHSPWRKLFLRPSSTFSNLPVLCRGLADELIRIADDDGAISLGGKNAGDVICRRVGAHPRERRQVRAFLDLLLADGFLVQAEDSLVIRNLAAAHGRRGAAVSPKADALGGSDVPQLATQKRPRRAREVREGCARGARGVREACVRDAREVREGSLREAREELEASAESDPTARNDSAESLTGARASEEKKRIEENRIEEIRSAPVVAVVEVEPPPASRVLTREPSPTPPAAEPDARPSRPALERAYVGGVRASTGASYAFPAKPWEYGALDDAIDAHGAARAPADLLVWIGSSVAAYVVACRESPTHKSKGFPPTCWLDWLNAGSPPAHQSTRPVGQRQPGLHKQPAPEGAPWLDMNKLREKQAKREGGGT